MKHKKVRNINEYKKEKKNKNKKRNRKKIFKVFIKFSSFIIALFIVIGNICGQVIISNLSYRVHYLKKDLKELEIKLSSLNHKNYKDMSIKEIEKRAREELNMDYPKKSQIRYIQVDN